MRNAEELSIMTHPEATTASRKRFDTEAPALNSAMSTPSKDRSVISSTTSSPFPNGRRMPSLRLDASAITRAAGKSRCSSTVSISRPTAPVTPGDRDYRMLGHLPVPGHLTPPRRTPVTSRR
jgi:hypothetical protein